MTWMEECRLNCEESWRKMVYEIIDRAINKAIEHKEETAMKVSYTGFTGELVKLERLKAPPLNGCHIYDLSIYDSEKQVTHSFSGIKLEDVKFLGGEVRFG